MEDKGGEAPTSSRWNPTKEQISVLEGLYKQGMRTPSAEQIQQITSRLKVYGHMEGKNVFYWFQNHKARQRQKQKQECMVYINQFLHKATHAPVFSSSAPPPCSTNVVCSPFYIPQSSAIGYYPHQHAKVPLPSSVRRRAIIADNSKTAGAVCFAPSYNEGIVKNNNNCHETLALFPLHPTGILEQGRSSSSSSSSPGKSFSSSVASNNHSISAETSFNTDDHDHQDGFSSSTKPSDFIDFFAEHMA